MDKHKSLKAVIEQLPLSPERQHALLDYFHTQIDNSTLAESFGLLCEFFVGQSNETPKRIENYFTYGSARHFVETVLLIAPWDAISDRMLKFMLAIPQNPEIVLAELAANLSGDIAGSIAFLTAKAAELGYDGDVADAIWAKAKMQNGDTLTPFGEHVLSLTAEDASATALRSGVVPSLALLYMAHQPLTFKKKHEFFVSHALQGSEYWRAVFAGAMCDLDPVAYLESIDRLFKSVTKDPKARFIAAYHMLRTYPQREDEAFAIAEKLALEIFEEKSIGLHTKAAWADNTYDLQIPLVGWLLEKFGTRAKAVAKKYKTENYVIMVKFFYPLVAEHLGQDGVDILYSGMTKSAIKTTSVWGFMEHVSYYQRMFQLASPFDMTKYDARIKKSLSTHKSKGVKSLVERVYSDDLGRRDVKRPTEKQRFSLRTTTRNVVEELADLIADSLTLSGPLTQIEIGVHFEDEPSIMGVAIHDAQRSEQLSTNIDLWTALPSLESFLKRHKVPEDHFSWSDSEQLPVSLYLFELGRAATQLCDRLAARDVNSTNDCRIQLDEYDLDGFVARYESSVRRQMGYQFVDNVAAREFALICYDDADDQTWLEQLANPLLNYTLTD